MAGLVCLVSLCMALRALAWANRRRPGPSRELYERRLREGPLDR
jgi:hypothetical protein